MNIFKHVSEKLSGKKMIKAGNGIFAFNPYDFMPGYGENSIEISIKKDYLIMYIYYDGLDDDEERISLHFPSVRFFLKTSFPHKSAIDLEYSDDTKLLGTGGLIEYPNSELIALSSSYANNLTHYKIIFLAENVSFDIVSEKYIFYK